MDYNELSNSTKHAIWLFEHYFKQTPFFSAINTLESCSCEDEFIEEFIKYMANFINKGQEVYSMIN